MSRRPLRFVHSAARLGRSAALLASLVGAACTSHGERAAAAAGEVATLPSDGAASATPASSSTPAPATSVAGVTTVARGDRAPNEMGRIPVLEYHLVAEKNALYERTRDGFRRDLETLYARGYRPVSVTDLLDKKVDLPAGLSPVVIVFDDASPSQFRYVEKDGKLEIDPTSAVGIWMDFRREHADWANKAVFCTLSGAAAGHNFFGDRNIEGQKTEWRFAKVRWLHEQGFELCNHTLWHANLARYSDAVVQEQIARGQMALDSVIPGIKVRTFALPQGAWPKNRALAHEGSWRDPKSGRTIAYRNEAILEVAGGPARSPFDPQFNPLSLPRVQVIGDSAVTRTLDRLERTGTRYVSDGNPATVARPAAPVVASTETPRPTSH